MSLPFFTLGHSSRTLEEFVALLTESSIELVVDVRKLPGSSRYPHFDEDPLGSALAERGVRLRRSQALTGRRPVSSDVPFDANAWWQNRSFHNYADHALGQEFQDGLTELQEWGRERRLAVMCSEAVWWRCHRRIVADHLLARGEDVRHIVGAGHVDAAELSAGAVVSNGTVTYPAGHEDSEPSPPG